MKSIMYMIAASAMIAAAVSNQIKHNKDLRNVRTENFVIYAQDEFLESNEATVAGFLTNIAPWMVNEGWDHRYWKAADTNEHWSYYLVTQKQIENMATPEKVNRLKGLMSLPAVKDKIYCDRDIVNPDAKAADYGLEVKRMVKPE